MHISRLSALRALSHTIGCDAKIDLVDLWDEGAGVGGRDQDRPGGALGGDHRRRPASRTSFIIAGAYWPPQYVIMDGPTLEPKKIVETRAAPRDTQEYHPEPRVAAIVASHQHPEFIVNEGDRAHPAGGLQQHRTR